MALCTGLLIALAAFKALSICGFALSLVAPLVGQVTKIGTGEKDWDAAGRLKNAVFWHSTWVLFMVHINSVYLGELQSLKIVPEVQTINTTFQQLIEQEFSFYSYPDVIQYYSYRFFQRSYLYTVLMSEQDFKEHKMLASRLLPMDYEDLT